MPDMVRETKELIDPAVRDALSALEAGDTSRAARILTEASLAAAGLAASAAPGFVRRCAEIEKWWSTGILGDKAELCGLARTRFDHFGHDSVRQAEQFTVREAVKLVALAARDADDGGALARQRRA